MVVTRVDSEQVKANPYIAPSTSTFLPLPESLDRVAHEEEVREHECVDVDNLVVGVDHDEIHEIEE